MSADELLGLFASGGLASMMVNGSQVNVGLTKGAGGSGGAGGVGRGRGVRGLAGVGESVGAGSGGHISYFSSSHSTSQSSHRHSRTLRRRLDTPPTPANPNPPTVHWDYQIGLHFRCGDRAYTQGAAADLQCQHDGTGVSPHAESDYMR